MTDTITVKISQPIIVNGTPTAELTFRKAKVRDLIVAETVGKGNQTATTVAILASMAGATYPAFQDMDVDDLTKVITETADLLGNGLSASGEAPPA